MFRERKFRFNVWVLGAAVTVAILLISKLLTLTGRWHSDIWSDAFFAVLTLAAVWLATGLMWAFVPTYVGPAGLRATDGVGRYHDVRWEEIEGVSSVCGFLWVRHGRLGKALTVPKFLEDKAGFREAVALYAPEGNPLRAALGNLPAA